MLSIREGRPDELKGMVRIAPKAKKLVAGAGEAVDHNGGRAGKFKKWSHGRNEVG